MKNHIVLLFIILAASLAFGAKKKKTDPKDARIETLTLMNDTLALQFDSLVKAQDSLLVQFDSLTGAYDSLLVQFDSLVKANSRFDSVAVVLDKVYYLVSKKLVNREFDYDQLPVLIDSLSARRDTSLAGFGSIDALKDSMAILKKDYTQMKTAYDAIMNDEAVDSRRTDELRHLKDLLDSQMLSKKEFEAMKAKLLKKW